MKLKRIKKWRYKNLLYEQDDYWEFHTLDHTSAKLFTSTVYELGGDVFSIIEERLIVCTLDGIVYKPGYVIYCSPLT